MALHHAVALAVFAAAPPPRHPPDNLLGMYTLNGTIPVEDFYIDESNEGKGTHYSYSADDIAAELANARSPSLFKRHPTDQLPPVGSSPRANHAWLLRAIEALALKGQRVLIFGSIDPRVECLCLAAGAAHVTTVDYNQLSFDHPALSTITVGELTALPQAALGFDAAVSLSSFDHDGLGRYGDRLHPRGDLLAMRTAWRALRPGGRLLLTVPVGPDVLVWNLHRRYGPLRLPLLLSGWEEEARFGWEEERFTAPASSRRSYEPLFILRRNGTHKDDLWSEPEVLDASEADVAAIAAAGRDEL